MVPESGRGARGLGVGGGHVVLITEWECMHGMPEWFWLGF